MKVLTWEEFKQCETGTVFSFWKPAIVDGLYMLHGWLERDGEKLDFWWSSLKAEPNCNSRTIEPPGYSYQRNDDGRLEPDRPFVVYHRDDLQRLQDVLNEAPDPPFEADECGWHGGPIDPDKW